MIVYVPGELLRVLLLRYKDILGFPPPPLDLSLAISVMVNLAAITAGSALGARIMRGRQESRPSEISETS